MFPPRGSARGFPRKPGPGWARPPPPRARGSRPLWNKRPWEPPHGRGSGRWHPHRSQIPAPSPGCVNFSWNEEEGSWAPFDGPPPPHWDGSHVPEHGSHGDWHLVEDLPPSPDFFDRHESLREEQHPPWPPPPDLRGERGGFQAGRPRRSYRHQPVRHSRRLRHGHRVLTMVQHGHCPPSRGKRPSSTPSASQPRRDHPEAKEQLKDLDSSQPPPPCKDGEECDQSREQGAEDSLAVGGKVLEPRGPGSTSPKSLPAEPQAVAEAAKPEQAGGVTPVEAGAGQEPVDVHRQSPSALEREPAPLAKSSAGPEEHPELEPCSQRVPEAAVDGGSQTPGPGTPPGPARRVCTAAGPAGEEGAELCPGAGAEQCLSEAAEDGEAAGGELLGGLEPSEYSQVPPGAAAEPDAPGACPAPEASPPPQHPAECSEAEPAVEAEPPLSSALPPPSAGSADLRSAAVLARKEEIELSYQQFSLTVAVVATMLLQKEPSMEASLGLALRANLRQGRIHHLQELEDFINSYDSATLSH